MCSSFHNKNDSQWQFLNLLINSSHHYQPSQLHLRLRALQRELKFENTIVVILMISFHPGQDITNRISPGMKGKVAIV